MNVSKVSNVMTMMAAVLLWATLSAGAHAQLAERKMLTQSAVENIMAAAQAEARENNWNVVIAIVDDGGHLLNLVRMDGARTASIDIAIGKARTSAGFGAPSKVFQDMVPNRQGFLSVSSDMVLLEGAMPIVVDGQVLGAVGVSGVRADQDEQIARAGIAGLQQ